MTGCVRLLLESGPMGFDCCVCNVGLLICCKGGSGGCGVRGFWCEPGVSGFCIEPGVVGF